MQKIFLTICFISCLLYHHQAWADIQPITGPIQMMQHRSPEKREIKPSGLPDFNNPEETRKFFKKRFEEVASTPMTKDTDWSNAMSVNIVKTPEEAQREEDSKKTLFQRIYEKALEAIHTQEENTENSENAE